MTVSPEQRLFALWVAVVAVAAIGLAIIFSAFADAAELTYCKIYANRMSAMALQRLIGVPFIDASTGKFLYRKAYSSCLLADEEPPIVLSEEQQPLIDGMPSPPTRPEPVQGSVPATDPADAPVAVPIAPAPKAKAKVKVTATTGADSHSAQVTTCAPSIWGSTGIVANEHDQALAQPARSATNIL